jgi:hypothetical protein
MSYACKSTTRQEARVRDTAGTAAPLPLSANKLGYPYVDPAIADGRLIPYPHRSEDYVTFSGKESDSARATNGELIHDEIFKVDASELPGKIETSFLNGTIYEPIPLPRNLILTYMRDFRTKYWRYGPNVDYETLPANEKDSEKAQFATIGTNPKDKIDPVWDVYPLSLCLHRYETTVAHWGPLQTHYFCMIPATFRGCYRYVVSSRKDVALKADKLNKRLLTADGTPIRELANAACLTYLAKGDEPVLEKLVQHSKIFQEIGITQGKQLSEMMEAARVGDYGSLLKGAIKPKDLSGSTSPAEVEMLYDAARKFYEDQYMTVDGEEVNLFDYIMFAPTLKFKLDDQLAVLNSFYFDMAAINPATGEPFWNADSGWKTDDFCFGRSSSENCSPVTLKTFSEANGR